MSWETAWGLVVFANVWALIQIAKLMKVDKNNEDATSASIKNLLKVVAMGSALVIGMVATGTVSGSLTDASISPSNSTLVDNFISANNALYNGEQMFYTVFIFFLFLFVLYMIIKNIASLSGGKRG